MPKHQQPKITLEKLAQMVQHEFATLRKEMATKEDLEAFATKLDLQDLRHELRDHLTELKTIMKQTIAEQVAHTVAIADLRRRLNRVERRIGMGK